MEVDIRELSEQRKKEILKSGKYVKIEILIGIDDDIPYSNCHFKECTPFELARAVKCMEELGKVIKKQEPIINLILPKLEISKSYIKDSREKGFKVMEGEIKDE